MWIISADYQPRFKGRDKVAMLWGFGRKPNSYTSPTFALSFTPLIGGAVNFGIALLTVLSMPEGKQSEGWIILVICGLIFCAFHAGHMHLATREE